jgi:putative flippase GtrA
MKRDLARVQFLRYAVVGLVSNAVLYGAYLALTRAGVEPKLAMTLLYLTGVVQTFAFNKRWSFRHDGLHTAAFARYCAAYAFGYAVNFAALMLLVDRLGHRHELVQAVMVVVLAVMLFLLQKYWVFRRPAPLPSNVSTGP